MFPHYTLPGKINMNLPIIYFKCFCDLLLLDTNLMNRKYEERVGMKQSFYFVQFMDSPIADGQVFLCWFLYILIFFLIDFSFNFDTRWCGSNKSQVGVGKSYYKACTKKLESFHQKPYRKFALRVSASELEKLGAILKLVFKSTRSIS